MSKILILGPTYPRNLSVLKKKISLYLTKRGYQPIILENEIKAGDLIFDKINDLIKIADYIVVLIPKKANYESTLFELGFLAANAGIESLAKKVLILKDESVEYTKISSFLRTFLLNKISYDEFTKPNELAEKIIRFVGR